MHQVKGIVVRSSYSSLLRGIHLVRYSRLKMIGHNLALLDLMIGESVYSNWFFIY